MVPVLLTRMTTTKTYRVQAVSCFKVGVSVPIFFVIYPCSNVVDVEEPTDSEQEPSEPSELESEG